MKVKYFAALAAASVFGLAGLTSCAGDTTEVETPEGTVEVDPCAAVDVEPDGTVEVDPCAADPCAADPCAADPCAAE